MSRYQIEWDNGSACGVFPQIYDNRNDAEREAEAWVAEMVANDPDPEDARDAYTYEIIEVE